MGTEIVKKDSTPGFGVAGQVMCPFSFMAPKMCLKHGCESWVELTYVDSKVGRCAFSWMPVIMTEIRSELEKVRKKVKN